MGLSHPRSKPIEEGFLGVGSSAEKDHRAESKQNGHAAAFQRHCQRAGRKPFAAGQPAQVQPVANQDRLDGERVFAGQRIGR